MPILQWLEIQGFRTFGATPQRLVFSTNLAILWGPNSQGKTSVAEALEFLLTGVTVRRDMLASAKAEFAGCLRNVHLPTASEVVVAAGISDTSGTVHEVRRKLLADYTAQEDCRSELLIDGRVVADMSSLGIHLPGAQLRAPVLMQHTLRYALSARPQDRTDYFKMILEIEDLETIRTEIAGLESRIPTPAIANLFKLRSCEGITGLEGIAGRIAQEGPSRDRIHNILHEAIGHLLEPIGVPLGTVPNFEQGIALLRAALESRRNSLFPLGSIQMPPAVTLALPTNPLESFRSFNQAREASGEESARPLELFTALLNLLPAEGAEANQDCPVCESQSALTVERIRAMRRYVEQLHSLTQASRAATESTRTFLQLLERVSIGIVSYLPASRSWSSDERQRFGDAAERLAPGSRGTVFTTCMNALDELTAATRELSSVCELVRAEYNLAVQRVSRGELVDCESLSTLTQSGQDAFVALIRAEGSYRAASTQLTATLQPEIDRASNFGGTGAFLEVCGALDALVEEVRASAASSARRQDLTTALEAIDAAKVEVFDAKYEALSGEIKRWWGLMRPGELTEFEGVRRRGTGRRFIDFKAGLRQGAGRPGVERDAVGVFSDSQLNCLGLSAFLARCVRQRVPFVILDDPVLATDEGHRTTFARHVVEALLAAGVQALVTTHDDSLQLLLCDYYRHIPLDVFACTLNAPADGTSVRKTSEQLETLLERARPYIGNHDADIRKMGAGRLRDAAERLCKEIVVKSRRIRGTECSILDFAGENLSVLVPATTAFLTDASHSGKLNAIARILNPGAHDDVPPSVQDLGVCMGDIKHLKQQYL